jgi:hypothetical protein
MSFIDGTATRLTPNAKLALNIIGIAVGDMKRVLFDPEIDDETVLALRRTIVWYNDKTVPLRHRYVAALQYLREIDEDWEPA